MLEVGSWKLEVGSESAVPLLRSAGAANSFQLSAFSFLLIEFMGNFDTHSGIIASWGASLPFDVQTMVSGGGADVAEILAGCSTSYQIETR